MKKIKTKCPLCRGTGFLDLSLLECIPFELANEAYRIATHLMEEYDHEEMRNLVEILDVLRKKLEEDDP